MKYDIYKQMPIAPATGIGVTGEDVFTLTPSLTAGAISKIKAVYIDLPADVILDINLSTITGNDDIKSPGNEAGSIVFRSGVTFTTPITITVTGTAGTAYGVKLVTEVEVPTVQEQPVSQAGLGWLLVGGLALGVVYASTRKKEERITIR